MKQLLLAPLALFTLALVSCTHYPFRADRTEKLEISSAGFVQLRTKTHNGRLEVRGSSPRPENFYVTAELTARGMTQEAADANLKLLNVTYDSDEGTLILGTKFDGPKRIPVSVSFDIEGPQNISLDLETHNGNVQVSGIEQDVRVTTHNGSVTLKEVHAPLRVKTHNGNLKATGNFPEMRLNTHNGSLTVENSAAGATQGHLKTHNGGIRVGVSPESSLSLLATTHNGSIEVPNDADIQSRSRRRVEASMGNGEGRLETHTHNGRVRVHTVSSAKSESDV